jgi:hypothetical protein
MPLLEGGISLESSSGAGQVISIQRESAMTIFQRVNRLTVNQYARALGLYSNVTLGQNLEGVFASMRPGKHLFSSRKKGCTWNPKGGVTMQVDTFPTCPIEYNGEQCPDVWFDNCFERLFAPGNDDMASTAEGQALLEEMLRNINVALGNSFFMLSEYAAHPLITSVNTSANYAVPETEWDDFYDQMTSGTCGGVVTQLDALKTAGYRGYTTDVPVNTTTGAFSGTFSTLYDAVYDSASPDLKTAVDNGIVMNDGMVRYPIVLATSEVYRSLQSYINSLAPGNQLAYTYQITGMDSTTGLTWNTLKWNGLPVVKWEGAAEFDAITGTKQHRLAIVAPGNFGVLANIDGLPDLQYRGMGLVIQKSPLLRDKNKYFMRNQLRWGAGIADIDLCAMASTVIHPGTV